MPLQPRPVNSNRVLGVIAVVEHGVPNQMLGAAVVEVVHTTDASGASVSIATATTQAGNFWEMSAVVAMRRIT